jgi:bifunctional non-homologous end joining protein LigD
MNLDVMLASSGKWEEGTFHALEGTHWFDVKWDGVRCLALIDHGHVQLINRNKVDITHRYPDVVDALALEFSEKKLILDGELVVLDPDGGGLRTDFKQLSKRDRQSDPRKIAALVKTIKVTYVAFDILQVGDQDLRDNPLPIRYSALVSTFDQTSGNTVMQSPLYSSWAAVRDLVERYKLEGVVAKSRTSTYRHGRQKAWVKLKPTQSDTFVVIGMEAGSGHRADSFGALLLGQPTPLGYEYVGKVGSGFNEQDLAEVLALWKSIESGERTEPIVVEVEYQEVTADGALRFPVYRGIRTDVRF